jgi:hypothetical protein
MERAGFDTRAEAETACMDYLGITSVRTVIKLKSRGRYEVDQVNPNDPVGSSSSKEKEEDEERKEEGKEASGEDREGEWFDPAEGEDEIEYV